MDIIATEKHKRDQKTARLRAAREAAAASEPPRIRKKPSKTRQRG